MTDWLTLIAAVLVVALLVTLELRWLLATARARRPPTVLESQPIAAALAVAAGRRRALRHDDGSLCTSLRGACICRRGRGGAA